MAMNEPIWYVYEVNGEVNVRAICQDPEAAASLIEEFERRQLLQSDVDIRVWCI